MTQRLNKVYAEGLTRFQTRGRSTSALPSPNVDNILSKYSGRKDMIGGTSKRLDIERLTGGAGKYEGITAGVGAGGRGGEIGGIGKIGRTEKEIMSRSTDKFLGKGGYEGGRYGGEYAGEYQGVQGRGRVDSYNIPSVTEHRAMDVYDRYSKYEPTGRLDKFDLGAVDHLYSKYSQPPTTTTTSQNLDYLRKDLDLKGLSTDYIPREKPSYPSDLSLYRNQKGTDRFTVGLEPEYTPTPNPRSLLKQLQEEPKKDALIGREFGREFGKELNRDYSRGGMGGLGVEKEMLMKEYGRTTGAGGLSKEMNKDYLKDYSAVLGREAGLARMKASEIGKSIGAREYGRGVDVSKYERYGDLKGGAYGENTPGVARKQDAMSGYRASLRGDY